MSSRRSAAASDPLRPFVTPDWAVRVILPVLRGHFPGRGPVVALEPAAGSGAIVRILHRVMPCTQVDAVEIRPEETAALERIQAGRVWTGDFLGVAMAPPDGPFGGFYDLIVTNPPFVLGLEYARTCLAMVKDPGVVALLLRAAFLETPLRQAFCRLTRPDMYFLPRRPSFTADGKTDSTMYAWFVWRVDSRLPQPAMAKWAILAASAR